jgi:hypothetical protein
VGDSGFWPFPPVEDFVGVLVCGGGEFTVRGIKRVRVTYSIVVGHFVWLKLNKEICYATVSSGEPDSSNESWRRKAKRRMFVEEGYSLAAA